MIFFEDGMYSSSGFVHVACLSEYCEGADFETVLLHFASGLSDSEISDLKEVASHA